ncbi:hypothetical protein [Thiolapillus sp.]
MKPYLNKALGLLALTAGTASFLPVTDALAMELVGAPPPATLISQENSNSYHAELQRRIASMSDAERKLLQSMNKMRQQDRISQNNESGQKKRHRKKDGKGSGKKRRMGQTGTQFTSTRY